MHIIMSALLSLPADCKLAIILAARASDEERLVEHYIDRRTLTLFLVLCKGFSQVVLRYFERIEEHYTICDQTPPRYCYKFCGLTHRNRDQPAVIWKPTSYGQSRFWYRYGKNHRDNELPAIIYADGTQVWYINGTRIRQRTPCLSL